MEKKKFLAVISNKAGNYQKDITQGIASVFAEKGHMVSFYAFEDSEKLKKEIIKAREQGYNSFLAVGGDGTVSLLASNLCGTPHRLGVIPAGTTNTLARVLGIPLEIGKAIEVAAGSDKARWVDGLDVSDRLFIMNVSVGLTSILLDNVDSKQKSRFGILAYILGILRSSNRIKPYNYKIQIDGNPYYVRAIELHVTNTGIIGMPQFRIYRDSHMDDGQAEVLTLRRWTIKEIFNTILDILTRRPRQAIRFIGKGEDILIQTGVPLTVQADGDILQKTPVKIKVVRQAINFIVP